MALIRRTKPISVVEARRLYEQTNLPVGRIAAMQGIGLNAFYRRVHLWGWRMRKPPVPRTDPPREPDEIRAVEAGQEPALPEIAATAARIRRAVESELDAVEKAIGQLTPRAGEDAERAARVLASLARTLHEVARLDCEPAPRAKDADEDRGPADEDEFIRDLARRMDEFARRGQVALPDKPPAETA